MPSHHPEHDELLSYVTGTSDGWLSTLIACHLTLCPRCREQVELLDALGGALLDDAAGMDFDAKPRLAPYPALGSPPQPRPRVPDDIARVVPRPLHGLFADDEPRFRFLLPGVKELRLRSDPREPRMQVVRFKPGFVVPQHGHSGLEWLLILSGELLDKTTGERFARGDVSRRHDDDVHVQVIGDREPCVAAFANVGPIIPHTFMGKLLAKFVQV